MNSVSIIGILKEKIDSVYRNFDYELPYSEDPSKPTPHIVVKYWSNQADTRLIVIPDNTRVAIHGHLDLDEKYGTILIVESFQTLR